MAWRNNTFSNHIHVGVRGADRAVAVCDALRPVLPVLLAASANSAWVEGRFSGLHTARTEIFTRMFPRCGVPDHFGGWRGYADYVDFLYATNSIVEHTQIWWSIRPHFSFGTVELRIMDAQSRGDESTALQGLATACIAQAALDYDDGVRPDPDPRPHDRGEHVAGDPLRARRAHDRPALRERDSRPGLGRAAAGLDSSRPRRARLDPHLAALARCSTRQRRSAPVAGARGRRRREGASTPASWPRRATLTPAAQPRDTR